MRTATVLVLLLLAGCHYPPPTDPCQPVNRNPGAVMPIDSTHTVAVVKLVCVDTAR